MFWVHPLVRALLAPYQLEPPDHDSYLSAPHWLLADRWAQTLAMGEHGDVEAFLRCQPNALASLAEGLDDDQLTRVVRASLANRPVVDVEEFQRYVASATGHRLGVQAWLDARLGEIEAGAAALRAPNRPSSSWPQARLHWRCSITGRIVIAQLPRRACP